jgi:hypothetical protein
MSLTAAQIAASVTWATSKTITGFASTKQDQQSIGNTITYDVTTFNQEFAAQYTIAAAGTRTIDLTSFTNALGESVTLSKVAAIIVVASGSSVKVEPGASNPLTWFFGGTTPSITVPSGGEFLFAQGTAQTVNSTYKTLLFTNTGGSTLTLTVVIIGGT